MSTIGFSSSKSTWYNVDTHIFGDWMNEWMKWKKALNVLVWLYILPEVAFNIRKALEDSYIHSNNNQLHLCHPDIPPQSDPSASAVVGPEGLPPCCCTHCTHTLKLLSWDTQQQPILNWWGASGANFEIQYPREGPATPKFVMLMCRYLWEILSPFTLIGSFWSSETSNGSHILPE